MERGGGAGQVRCGGVGVGQREEGPGPLEGNGLPYQ